MKKKYNLDVDYGSVIGITGLISITQAAKILAVTPQTLRNWDKSGKFKAVGFGKHRKYRKLDVLKVLT